MTQITVDAELAAKLLSAGLSFEIVDESGKRLAAFQRQCTIEDAIASCPYSDEELEKLRKKPGPARPLDDILRDLEKMP